MHIDGARPPTGDDLIATMRAYALPVYVTEMDVNMRNVPVSDAARWDKQASVYASTIQAALDSGLCKYVALWDIGDKYSWLENTSITSAWSSPIADATPFDDALLPKPAYYAIRDVLKRAAEKR